MTDNGNSVMETIYNRRAVRRFKDTPVPAEMIDKIIAAGRMAPSAINKQPWKFYVFRNREKIAALSASIRSSSKWQMLKAGMKEAVHALLHPSSFKLSDGIKFMNEDDPIFHGAPVVILLTSPRRSDWAALDLGMCAQNMMLAAHSLGLATCPVGLAKFIENTSEPGNIGIGEDETVQLAIIMGYAAEVPEMHPRRTDNVKYID